MRRENLSELAESLRPYQCAIFVLTAHAADVESLAYQHGAQIRQEYWRRYAFDAHDIQQRAKRPNVYERMILQYSSEHTGHVSRLLVELESQAKPYTCVTAPQVGAVNIRTTRIAQNGEYKFKGHSSHDRMYRRCDHIAHELRTCMKDPQDIMSYVQALMADARPIYDEEWEGQLEAYKRAQLLRIVKPEDTAHLKPRSTHIKFWNF